MRNYQPCRVCGAEHTNPSSSSICPACGASERRAAALKRIEKSLLADHQMESAMRALRLSIGADNADAVKNLIEVMLKQSEQP